MPRSVTCKANPGKTAELPDGRYVYECPWCEGDVDATGQRARHEPLRVVSCPVYPDREPELFGLWEDATYECNHCGCDVTVVNGKASHETVYVVECDATGEDALIPESEYKEGETYDCPYCRSEIWEDVQGNLHHSRYLERLRSSSSNAAYVLVHGFLNDEDKDFTNWREQLLRLGWIGDIYGYQWSATSPGLVRLARILAIAALRARGYWRLAAGAAATAAFLRAYRDARGEAEREGRRLAQAIIELRREYKDVRLLAFSLGCRATLHALRELHRIGVDGGVRVVLCGGAVPATTSWRAASKAVKGRIANYYSEGDDVLKWLFPVGEATISGAIGSTGVRGLPASKIANRPAQTDDGRWLSHVFGDSYEKMFAEVGRP